MNGTKVFPGQWGEALTLILVQSIPKREKRMVDKKPLTGEQGNE